VAEQRSLTGTYRLQMNAGCTFEQVRERVDYFSRLGVSHLYCSPIFAARRGSMHGYDVVDPTRINPEIGTERNLRALADDLHARGMGLLLDIVPNHMGIGAENPYWDDVLAHGERSRYARWFDIDWISRPLPSAMFGGKGHKLVLPVLGDELDRVLARGELSVRVREGAPPRIVYFDQSFPIDPASSPPELQLVSLDPEETGELAELYSGTAGSDRLRDLLETQHYRLTGWQRAASEINYRRFFDVNDLAALRMEDRDVFDETHALIVRLVREGIADGLRVDHVDGLRDPREYLERLRAATGPATIIMVEKILSAGETLPDDWPVQGTTGYEFLNDLEDALIEPEGYEEIERCYRHLRRLGPVAFSDIVAAAKASVLHGALGAEVDRLVALLRPIALAGDKRWDPAELAAGISSFIENLPVYRTYFDERTPVGDADRTVVETALSAVRERAAPSAEVAAFIADVLLDALSPIDAAARLAFIRALQQVSGPAAAKGVEDTALYVYVPLVSRNEVGGAPDRSLDDAVDRLHEGNRCRARRWPLALTATNTHDTKRSADVRARLDALTEVPHEWERAIRRWRRLNAKHRRTVKGRMAPDTNTEYLIYQTLIALWPPPRAGRRADDLPDRAWRDGARTRLVRYARKAAREAKVRTSWASPDTAYERALEHFAAAILEPAEDAPFLTDVARLVSRIAPAGAWNALSRVVVHLTAPGTPDVYQGDELWNLTLVDPDNRRPVDFEARATLLDTLGEGVSGAEENWMADPFDDRLKLFVTQRLLDLRRSRGDLFARGEYFRLNLRGARARHVVAFARHHDDACAVTLAPRLIARLIGADPVEWWSDTAVELPDVMAGRRWRSQIVPGELAATGSTLELGALFRALPMAVLVS
jgi:(1->4)-alpha-D-glucan 1-alpha-D-glucosylmutase